MSICRKRDSSKKRIAVVVMGDVDRSPRMINHALSIANLTSYYADLIGYKGNSLPESVQSNPKIQTRYLSTKLLDKLRKMPKALYLVYAILRIIIQVLQLIYVFASSHYDYVLMQNPPCVPLLFVLVFMKVTRLSRSHLIIDWHNYGYSIMKVNRVNKALVFIAKIYEMKLGRYADSNLCVSQAMQVDLVNKFQIKNTPHVLYDKATRKFKQLEIKDKHELFKKLNLGFEKDSSDTTIEHTLFTTYNSKTKDYQMRTNRPVFCLSSTSYTPDEDFMVLITALDQLNKKINDLKSLDKNFNFPRLQFIVTGKGPLKDHYLEIFNQKNKEWKEAINIHTVWLDVDDYPKIVASADLGVCLHFSSSGFDLPMKVVDMFSAQLPCLAYSYLCIDELVEDGKNGKVFSNEDDLKEQIFDTLKGFDSQNGTAVLRKYKDNLKGFAKDEWDTQWERVMVGKVIKDE